MKKRLLYIIAICVVIMIIGSVAFASQAYGGVSASFDKGNITYEINNLKQSKQRDGSYKLSMNVSFINADSVEFASPIVLASDSEFKNTIKISQSSVNNGKLYIEANTDEKADVLYIKMPTPIVVIEDEISVQYIAAKSTEYRTDNDEKGTGEETVTYMTLVFDAQELPVTPRFINIVSNTLNGTTINCISSTSYRDNMMKTVCCEFTYAVPTGYKYEEDFGAELLLGGDFIPLEPAVVEIMMK